MAAVSAPQDPALALQPVRRLRRPDVDEVRALARAGVPAVIEGAIDDWPAVGRWSPAYLAERAGPLRVPTYVIPSGHVKLDRRTGFELVEMRVDEYVAHACSGEPPRYYLRAPLSRLPDALQREVCVPRYCRGALRLRQNVWFSAPDTITHLHFDLPHNLIAQLHGSKRFRLFPFRERPRLYPHPAVSSTPHLSRVDLERPDFGTFPRLREARGVWCDLREGDLLLLPSMTWHQARSLGTSVTLNTWWPPLRVLPVSVLSDLYKRLRGLNI